MTRKIKITLFIVLGIIAFVLCYESPEFSRNLQDAKDGITAAQFYVGKAYYTGHGVLKDHKAGIHWIGQALFNESREAPEWILWEASKGDPGAQYLAGVMFDKGFRVEKDFEKAFAFYQRSAAQGYPDAQRCLGVMYDFGHGVEKNNVRAAYWYRKAAEQGDPYAQFSLGNLYEWGEGVPQNYKTAVKWYRKSAKQKNSSGEWGLGSMYLFGKGVKKDPEEAKKWLIRSASGGNKPAQKFLREYFHMKNNEWSLYTKYR